MGSVVTALLFICGILAFLVSNPEVAKSIHGSVEEQEEMIAENDEERQRMMLVLNAILDRLEQKENSEQEKPTFDVDLAKRLVEQDAMETFAGYRGDDSFIRQRLGLPPKIVVDNITVSSFEQEFNTRFGVNNVLYSACIINWSWCQYE
jgi:hypothetical protein